MAIKYTFLGAMIYLAMAAWLGAFVAHLSRSGRLGEGMFAFGFVAMVAAFGYRWLQTGHWPMQNLFEVFCCLGVLMYPLWLFCRRFLGARSPAANVLLGALVLFPAGFIFKAQPQMLPPALRCWLFAPHVAAYLLAYAILLMAGIQAAPLLARPSGKDPLRYAAQERATHGMICLAFPLLTLGLVLGAWWGKLAWSDYWHWDPKELWSLASWLVYVAYLHFRGTYGRRYPRVNSALAVLGCVVILVTLLWVNLAATLFPGLHAYAT